MILRFVSGVVVLIALTGCLLLAGCSVEETPAVFDTTSVNVSEKISGELLSLYRSYENGNFEKAVEVKGINLVDGKLGVVIRSSSPSVTRQGLIELDCVVKRESETTLSAYIPVERIPELVSMKSVLSIGFSIPEEPQ